MRHSSTWEEYLCKFLAAKCHGKTLAMEKPGPRRTYGTDSPSRSETLPSVSTQSPSLVTRACLSFAFEELLRPDFHDQIHTLETFACDGMFIALPFIVGLVVDQIWSFEALGQVSALAWMIFPWSKVEETGTRVLGKCVMVEGNRTFSFVCMPKQFGTSILPAVLYPLHHLDLKF